MHQNGPTVFTHESLTINAQEEIVLAQSIVDTALSGDQLMGIQVSYDPAGDFDSFGTVNGDVDIIGEWIA